MQSPKIRQYFPGSNTCLGFYSLWESNINDLSRLIIFKGGPGTGKSTLLSNLAKAMIAEGWETELLWCSSDAASLDGVIFRGLGLGIIDGTVPHLRDPLYPGVIDKIINLGEYWSEQELLRNKDEIIRLTDQNRSLFQTAYQYLAQAKESHDLMESFYISGMNWSAVSSMSEELIWQLFRNSPAAASPGKERHRFASALTPQGPVNYLQKLLSAAKTRYIIKGRAGTGKSTLIKKIAAAAQAKGYNVDYYHCGFDPHSIDGIYIPALELCVIDGTSPHEITPESGDIVIDMFSFMSGSVYGSNQKAIRQAEAGYHTSLQKALEILKECKAVHDQLEEYYVKAMDFSSLDAVYNKLLLEIKAWAETE